jgi:hypothetical protein
VTRYYLEHWLGASEESRLSALDARTYAHLAPIERMRQCTFDNVCSCIRRSVWLEHPFRPTPIAEDLVWAKQVLLAGYQLAFAPQAVVTHSHDRSAAYEFERTRLLHRRLFELFGVRTIPSGGALLRAVGVSLALHLRLEASDSRPQRLRRVGRGAALAVMWPFGQYVGGREGASQSAGRSWLASSQRV